MNRKITAHYTLVGGQLRSNIVVEVDSSRRIVSVVESEVIDSMAGVEFYPGILIPGMVNLHCHLELAYLRGAIEEQTGFAGFARAIGMVRDKFTIEERLHAASVADSAMWQEGIEAVLDIANDDVVMPVKERSKIEYRTLFELFGLGCNSITKHQEMAERYTNSSITPHSTYSLQDQTFRSAASNNRSTISIHMLESEAETELYRGQGSLMEWYERMGWECDFLHYGSPAQRVVRSIEPSRNVVLVHGCRATEEDVALISDHFKDNVTWALCPESNRYISNDRPPVELLRKMGCRIGIGTDSLASARSLSLIDNLRLIDDVPLDEALTWATKGGAEALGMDHLGEIAVGKRPGLVIIRDADLHNLRLTPESRAERVV
jgi:cytosine/adenosine deaminase-related metal-dependent hydrolase